jgi:hypothetical protein
MRVGLSLMKLNRHWSHIDPHQPEARVLKLRYLVLAFEIGIA